MDAAMDPEVRRMLADLGSARRDAVSAPEERGSRVDERQQVAVAADFEARRAHQLGGDAGQEDERASRLRAWNTQDNFERDEVTDQLENRFSGQGHRARRNRQANYDDRREAEQARVGEERSLWLQQKSGSYDNYGQSTRIAKGHDWQQRNGGNGSHAQSTHSVQRNHAQSPDSRHFHDGKRVAGPPKAPDHARAPSPSRSGKVRFVNGSRVDSGSSRAVSSPASMNVRTANTAPPKPTAPISVPKESTTPVVDYYAAQQYHSRALWYAATPGPERDQYYKNHPEEEKYLLPAIKQLVKEVTMLAKRDNNHEIEQYLQTHRDREWMVNAAKKAKELIEDKTEEEIAAYVAQNSKLEPFVWSAKYVFTPKAKPDLPPQPKSSDAELSSHPGGNDDDHYDDSNNIKSVETGVSLPAVSRLGTLAASFFNVDGESLGIRKFSIDAPIQAEINVTSCAGRFNPLSLINAIEKVAQSMIDRTRGLEGVRLADDGLWVDF